MYGLNEFVVLQRASQDLVRKQRDFDHGRWIKEAEVAERRKRRRASRRRWSAFLSLFVF